MLDGVRLNQLVNIGGYDFKDRAFRKAFSKGEMMEAVGASAWAYRCGEVRSTAAGGVGFELVRGERVIEGRHPAGALLTEVNEDSNLGDLLRDSESDICEFGWFAWVVEFGRLGMPHRLRRLHPIMCEVLEFEDRIVGVREYSAKGATEYDRRGLVFFKLRDPRGPTTALAPLEVCYLRVVGERDADAMLWHYFKNYAVPEFIVTSERNLTDAFIERLLRWWDRRLQGIENRGRPGVLSGGLKPMTIGSRLNELAMKETRDEIKYDICGAYGVPPALAGVIGTTNRSDREHVRRIFYEDLMRPHWDNVAQAINADLVSKFWPGLALRWQWSGLPVFKEDQGVVSEWLTPLYMDGLVTPEAYARRMGLEIEELTPVGRGGGEADPLTKAQEAEARALRAFLRKGERGREFEPKFLEGEQVQRIKHEFSR